jgi:DNA-binding transcriptional ArsR family regulator
MVEYLINLDTIFNSLADPTRRDILKRVARKEMSVGEVAEPYGLTFAAVSKHLKVLEKAKLINKRKEGNHHFIVLSPPTMKEAADYLKQYQIFWEERFSRLDQVLESEKAKLKNKKYGKK